MRKNYREKEKLKDNALISLDQLKDHLTYLLNDRYVEFMSYRALKEYIRLCVVNYDKLTNNEKQYLERYYFGRLRGRDENSKK